MLDNILLSNKVFFEGTSSDTNYLSLTNIEDLLLYLNQAHKDVAKDLIIDKVNNMDQNLLIVKK
jgi:hypothetical protein